MTRIVLITGGHPYEHAPFIELFKSLHDVEFREVPHPEAEREFTPEAAGNSDAFVFYDFDRNMSATARQNFVNTLERGKGVVFLHHALYSQPTWPDYLRIMGGFWKGERFEIDGKSYGPSTATVDIEQHVRIADPAHPITRGMKPFTMVEECYGNIYVAPDVHVLLETDHPQSQRQLAWAHTYSNARIVYLQPGHGPRMYADPNYRGLIERSIQWVCKKL